MKTNLNRLAVLALASAVFSFLLSFAFVFGR